MLGEEKSFVKKKKKCHVVICQRMRKAIRITQRLLSCCFHSNLNIENDSVLNFFFSSRRLTTDVYWIFFFDGHGL